MKKSDITKEKIMTAAEAIFAKKGLAGARVDEIAELSGVNKRMIYAHFGNKEGLYIAVLETVYSRLSDKEREVLDTELSCTDAIKSVIRHYFTFLSQNPTFVKMLMWENLNEAQYLRLSDAPKAKGVAVSLLRNTLKRGVEQGVFRAGLDLDEMVISINMFCFSYFSNIHTMSQIVETDLGKSDALEKHCEHVIDIIFNYILEDKR